MKPRIYVSGTIELNDNIHSKVKFSLDTEAGTWQQWGNTNEKMFKTVDIATKMQEAIMDSDILNNLEIGVTDD